MGKRLNKVLKIQATTIMAVLLLIGGQITTPHVLAAGVTASVMSAVKGADNKEIVLNVTGLQATNGVTKIDCEVWSANGSKDDIKTYELLPDANGIYTQKVLVTDHKNDAGVYYVDVYATDNSNDRAYIGNTYALIEQISASWIEWKWNGTNFDIVSLAADVTVDGKMTPNVEANNTATQIKSGYGYSLDVTSKTKVSSILAADGTVTGVQSVNTVFPEFNFKNGVTWGGNKSSFNQLGIVNSYVATGNTIDSTVNFKANPFSTNNSAVHFTPLWYPDATEYKISVDVFDAWTPAGMLSSTVTPSTTVDGQVYDDWHIAPIQ